MHATMDPRSPHAPRAERAHERTIFVYGTLRRGAENHRFLSGGRFLGEADTAPEFELFDLGGFPALVRGGTRRVHGELWAVDGGTLALLDEFEDHPEYFRRSRVVLADGQEADAYLLGASQAAGFPRIASGDWCAPR